MILNFREHKSANTTIVNDIAAAANRSLTAINGSAKLYTPEAKEENDEVGPLRSNVGRTNSQTSLGLWGPKPKTANNGLWGPPKQEEWAERAHGPKRRWTITEPE
jgi:hypothetical protein